MHVIFQFRLRMLASHVSMQRDVPGIFQVLQVSLLLADPI